MAGAAASRDSHMPRRHERAHGRLRRSRPDPHLQRELRASARQVPPSQGNGPCRSRGLVGVLGTCRGGPAPGHGRGRRHSPRGRTGPDPPRRRHRGGVLHLFVHARAHRQRRGGRGAHCRARHDGARACREMFHRVSVFCAQHGRHRRLGAEPQRPQRPALGPAHSHLRMRRPAAGLVVRELPGARRRRGSRPGRPNVP